MIDEPLDDEYLWQGTGAPDAHVRRLEELLARYRHQGTWQPPPDDASDDDTPSE